MTPLLPSPDHYLQNLITMTSPEAKRLWRRAIKSTSIVNVSIVEKLMNYMNLLWITFVLAALVVKTLHQILFPHVGSVIRLKAVEIGYRG